MTINAKTVKITALLMSLLLLITSCGVPAYGAVSGKNIIWAEDPELSKLDATASEYVSSIYIENTGNTYLPYISGRGMGTYSGSSFTLGFDPETGLSFEIRFYGMDGDSPRADVTYVRKAEPSVPKTVTESASFTASGDMQKLTVGGKTYTCSSDGLGNADCGTVYIEYDGKKIGFSVEIRNGKAYVTKENGETLSFAGLSGVETYLEWWVPAQLIEMNYLASGLPMYGFEEAGNHTYTSSQIDKALANYTITMINKATGETKDALLKTDLTYWARNEGSSSEVGTGTYTEYTSGTRVVKQWSELSASQKTYFAGDYANVTNSSRLFAVYPSSTGYCTIASDTYIEDKTGEWGPWTDSGSSCREDDGNTRCTPSGYTKTVITNSVSGWDESFPVTSCTPSSPSTDSDGMKTGYETRCTDYVKVQERTVKVGAWDKGNESVVSSCVNSATRTCTSGYTKYTRTVTVGAWSKDASYSSSCTASASKKCISGYYRKTVTTDTFGGWTTYGGWQSGSKPSDNSTRICETYYKKVTTTSGSQSCSYGTAYNQTCENCSTSKPSSGTYRTVYRYGCSTKSLANGGSAQKYYYDTVSASAGTQNTSVCSTSYPYVIVKTAYYQKASCTTSGGTSSTSYVSTCSQSSTVTCTSGYRCKTRSDSQSTSKSYATSCQRTSGPTSSTTGTYSYTSSCESGYYSVSTRTVSTGDWAYYGFTTSCSAETNSITQSTNAGTYTDSKCTAGYYATDRTVTYGDWGNDSYRSSCPGEITHTVTRSTDAGTYTDTRCYSGYYARATRNWYRSQSSEQVSECTPGSSTYGNEATITTCTTSSWLKSVRQNERTEHRIAKAGADSTVSNPSVMSAAEIMAMSADIGHRAAQCEYLRGLDTSDPDYLKKADYDTGEWKTVTMNTFTAGKESYNRFLSEKIFIPYVYITAHWRATKGNGAYTGTVSIPFTVSSGGETAGDTAVTVTIRLTRSEWDDPDDPVPPEKPEENETARDTRVVYYDYNEPLANYESSDIPENWKGYDALVSEIKRTDFGDVKIRVSLSASDLREMREWLEENPESIGTCEMLRKFSYVFSGSDRQFLSWLRLNGGSCSV